MLLRKKINRKLPIIRTGFNFKDDIKKNPLTAISTGPIKVRFQITETSFGNQKVM